MSVYIVSSCRTPIAKFSGSYSHVSAADLGSQCIREALRRASDSTLGDDVDEIFMGQVFTCGAGQNPARQSAVRAGLPYSVNASTVNMVCGSGMRAVVNGYQAIRAGDSAMVLAGGQESMTRAPHFMHVRGGSLATFKTGNVQFQDSMMVDGLHDAFSGALMGTTAERVAHTYHISRETQDAFALASQTRALHAIANGHFADEIVPVCTVDTPKLGRKRSAMTNGHGTTNGAAVNGSTEKNGDDHYAHDDFVSVDECPRASTVEGLRRLPTAFDKTPGGTVTAGNSSGLADGAACLLLASEEEVARRSLHPQARLVSWSQCGVDPSVMGIGPVQAIRKALDKAHWSLDDVDLFEINEAFAATSLAVLQELGLTWSADKATASCADRVNVSGGAIALGHPLGMSGARLLVTLTNQLRRTGKRRGVAALCIGGGQGIATCLEAL